MSDLQDHPKNRQGPLWAMLELVCEFITLTMVLWMLMLCLQLFYPLPLVLLRYRFSYRVAGLVAVFSSLSFYYFFLYPIGWPYGVWFSVGLLGFAVCILMQGYFMEQGTRRNPVRYIVVLWMGVLVLMLLMGCGLLLKNHFDWTHMIDSSFLALSEVVGSIWTSVQPYIMPSASDHPQAPLESQLVWTKLIASLKKIGDHFETRQLFLFLFLRRIAEIVFYTLVGYLYFCIVKYRMRSKVGELPERDPSVFFFTEFEWPFFYVIFVLASGLAFVVGEAMVSAVAFQVLALVMVPYFLQGLAVLQNVVGQVGGSSIGMRVFVAWTSFVFMYEFLIVVGFFDQWFNFRMHLKKILD